MYDHVCLDKFMYEVYLWAYSLGLMYGQTDVCMRMDG